MCFWAVKILLSKFRQNSIVRLCLENPNKSKSETVEYFQLLGYQKPTIYRNIKRFEKLENLERIMSSIGKCAFSWSKARAALKKHILVLVSQLHDLGWHRRGMNHSYHINVKFTRHGSQIIIIKSCTAISKVKIILFTDYIIA
jgi:hypothetical protein